MDRDYENVRNFVLRERRTGAAYLHQHLLLGKNKIERILVQLEKDGVVSKVGPGGARDVLMDMPIPQSQNDADQNVDAHDGHARRNTYKASAA